jgi:hypothetical protein
MKLYFEAKVIVFGMYMFGFLLLFFVILLAVVLAAGYFS